MDIIEYRQLEDFSNRLLLYISDEEQANSDYESLSNKATELGSHDIAHVLYEMAQDELRHKGYLEDMTSRIKEVLARERSAPKYPIGSRVILFGMPGSVVGQMCEGGRWRCEVMSTDSEGKLQQNWAFEEDIEPEY